MSLRDSPDRTEQLLALAALTLAIELVLFKFLPDLSTALLQQTRSTLTDFAEFQRAYLSPGSVHHARFLGNYILYNLAQAIAGVHHSADPRLHPLRVAAGIVTPIYAYLGVLMVLSQQRHFAWRPFVAAYGLMVVIGLYVFYPADMPSLACLSMALFFLLNEQLLPALILTLLTGLFRETSFHMVWLVAVWACYDRKQGARLRLAWVAVFALAFVVEYTVVRRFFPGPVSSAEGGGIVMDLRTIFLDRGILSLTTICSLGLAALYPLGCLARLRGVHNTDWRVAFFRLNCYVFPAWVVFYRMMNGNLSEFRMLFPVLIPCIYGLAFSPEPIGSAATQPSRRT